MGMSDTLSSQLLHHICSVPSSELRFRRCIEMPISLAATDTDDNCCPHTPPESIGNQDISCKLQPVSSSLIVISGTLTVFFRLTVGFGYCLWS